MLCLIKQLNFLMTANDMTHWIFKTVCLSDLWFKFESPALEWWGEGWSWP